MIKFSSIALTAILALAGNLAFAKSSVQIRNECATVFANRCANFKSALCKASPPPAELVNGTRDNYDGFDASGKPLEIEGMSGVTPVTGGFMVSLTQLKTNRKIPVGPTLSWKPSLYFCPFKGDKSKALRLTMLIQLGNNSDPLKRVGFNIYQNPVYPKGKTWTSSPGLLDDETLEKNKQTATCREADSSQAAQIDEVLIRNLKGMDPALDTKCRYWYPALDDCEKEATKAGDAALAATFRSLKNQTPCSKSATTGKAKGGVVPTVPAF